MGDHRDIRDETATLHFLRSPSLRATAKQSRLSRRCGAKSRLLRFARNGGHWISSGYGTDTGGQRNCHREGDLQQRQRLFDFGVETFRRLRRLGEIIVASQNATHRMEAERAVDLEALLAAASNI